AVGEPETAAAVAPRGGTAEVASVEGVLSEEAVASASDRDETARRITVPSSSATSFQAADGDAAPAKATGGEGWTEPWAKLIADPRHAPELLALAAVQTIGPRAQEWIARTRAAYPTASDRAIARLATLQF